MNEDSIIALTGVFLIAAVVMLIIPMSNITGAAAVDTQPIPENDCERAANDLVRLNNLHTEIPELLEDLSFRERLNTAKQEVKNCYNILQ